MLWTDDDVVVFVGPVQLLGLGVGDLKERVGGNGGGAGRGAVLFE
jgi:hypothetical protein